MLRSVSARLVPFAVLALATTLSRELASAQQKESPSPTPAIVSQDNEPHALYVHFQVLEIDLTAARQMELDLSALTAAADSGVDTRPVVDRLVQKGVASVRAEAALSTLSGRLAHVTTGGQIVVDPSGDTRREFVGTRTDVLPCLDRHGQVDLQLKLEHSWLQQLPGGQPHVRRRSCKTQLRMGLDRTVVLASEQARQKDSQEQTRETLTAILARVEASKSED